MFTPSGQPAPPSGASSALRTLDPAPEALRASAGNFWALAQAGDPPCLRWEATTGTAAEALAVIEQRWGSSRARLGPFPIVQLIEAGPSHPVADPGAAQHTCEVYPGDLLILALLGVEAPAAGDPPAPGGPPPRFVVADRFAATRPDAALAQARGARGWSIVVRVESLPQMMDGHSDKLPSWRVEAMPAEPSEGGRP